VRKKKQIKKNPSRITLSTIEQENKEGDQILEEKAVSESSRIIPSSERRLLALTRNTTKKIENKRSKKKKNRETEIESARTKPVKHVC
jgi:hypothetical protein